MVCPICVTTAIVANAPALAGAVGGFAAVKLALDKRGVACVSKTAASRSLADQPSKAQAVPVRVNDRLNPDRSSAPMAPRRPLWFDIDEMDP